MVIFLSDSRLQLLVFFSSFFIDYYTHWRNIVLDRIDVIQWSGESRTRRTIFIEIYWIRNLIRKRNFCCWIWFRIFDVISTMNSIGDRWYWLTYRWTRCDGECFCARYCLLGNGVVIGLEFRLPLCIDTYITLHTYDKTISNTSNWLTTWDSNVY